MAKNIIIHKGPIYKVFAENVTLVKDQVVPVPKEEVAIDEAYFYYSAGRFVNMEYSCILPDNEEARHYMESIINNREQMIKRILFNPEISDKDKEHYLSLLQLDTSCIYYNENDLEPVLSLPKKDFKELKKNLRREDF